MNEICAKVKRNTTYNPSMLLMGHGLAFGQRRSRRSLDINDDEEPILIGNDSYWVDDLDDEMSTSTTTTPASIQVEDVDYMNTDLMEKLKNTTQMIRKYLDENYEAFRHSSEINAMTTFATLGLFLNFLALLAIVLDRRTALTSRRVHGSYIVAQQVFLVFVVCFVHTKKDSHYAKYADLEAMNYFTVCLGLMQFIQPWMLFAVAGYVRGCLESLFDIGKAPRFPVAFVAASILFAGLLFSMYLPPVRVVLYHALPGYVLCEDPPVPPVERLWNLDKDESMEIVNVLVYNLSYIFAVYLVPSILIAYRSKGIVDLLHALQLQPKVLANRQELACTSLVISVTCNLHLVCVTIKVVVYLFYLVELFFKFVEDAFVFFQYLSVFANLLIIIGTGCHALVLTRYNRTVQYFLLRIAYQMKLKIYWLSDSLPKWKKTSTKESDPVVEADASSQT